MILIEFPIPVKVRYFNIALMLIQPVFHLGSGKISLQEDTIRQISVLRCPLGQRFGHIGAISPNIAHILRIAHDC